MNILSRPPKWPGSHKTKALSLGGDELRLSSFLPKEMAVSSEVQKKKKITKQTKSSVEKKNPVRPSITIHITRVKFILFWRIFSVFHQIRKKVVEGR